MALIGSISISIFFHFFSFFSTQQRLLIANTPLIVTIAVKIALQVRFQMSLQTLRRMLLFASRNMAVLASVQDRVEVWNRSVKMPEVEDDGMGE